VTFFADEETDDQDGPYVRRVLLPLRPLDLEEQLAGEETAETAQAGDRDGDGTPDETDPDPDDPTVGGSDDPSETGCVTVAQCAASHPDLAAMVEASAPGVLQSMANRCARDLGFPGLPADCQ
jgi:hypothetical protein